MSNIQQVQGTTLLFILGSVIFIVAVASAFENTCKLLVTDCPIVNETPRRQNTCIIDYMYMVDSHVYNGSFISKEPCSGDSHLAVCFDTNRPWKHTAALSSSNLDPGIYVLDIVGIWLGIGLMVPVFVHLLIRGARDNQHVEMIKMKRSDSATSI